MNKELEQEACNFAGDRNLGAGHGYPSFEANLLERGFIAGATSNWVEKQKIKFTIEQLNNLEFNPRENIVEFILHIKDIVKELEQKLSEFDI